ncbi:hypothetical protein [Oscillibacter sp. 1-3]|uniref:hypothetical protein n=1 Tax=Oscillibacter sp. 1-3 TaxID=1235797 RepID=UPI001A98023B|nr:hypothetical protein [Oscillibacter sp. 1-3]
MKKGAKFQAPILCVDQAAMNSQLTGAFFIAGKKGTAAMKCPLSSRQNREKERQEWQ